MARIVTLASLRLQAQRRADMENSSFLGTQEWNDMINASAAELYDILTRVYEDYFQASFPFVTVSGQSAYPLPSDFYKLLGLDQQTGVNVNITCQPFEFAERNKFSPYNSSGQSFTVQYVPSCPLLVYDTDTFDGVNGWEEYIVVDVAIKALTKEESSTQELEAAKMALLKRIESSAPNRDAGMSGRVTDIHAIDPYFGLTSPAPAHYRVMAAISCSRLPSIHLGRAGYEDEAQAGSIL